MSLAEPKRKVKYCINPRGHLWANDKNKFGLKMLQKMGWSEGKGLGKNEDGTREHVKSSNNFNSQGLGYKEKDNIPELNSEYEQLLASLNSKRKNKEVEEEKQDGEEKEEDEEEKEEDEEEKKTKKRKIVNRHRYSRMRKSKDVSSYSQSDLKSILVPSSKLETDS